jgi:hypothetical protein
MPRRWEQNVRNTDGALAVMRCAAPPGGVSHHSEGDRMPHHFSRTASSRDGISTSARLTGQGTSQESLLNAAKGNITPSRRMMARMVRSIFCSGLF